MSSLRTFRIEFDRPGATYAPGEVVTGNVIVDLAKEKTVRALIIKVKGEANVKWERPIMTNDHHNRHDPFKHNQLTEEYRHFTHFDGNEHYFYQTYSLLGNTGGGEVRMLSGHSKYSFSFLLPNNIPCSFEHKYGHIRYTAKAVIDRPWRFDYECKIAFTVVSSYDLNIYRDQCIGIDDEVNKSFCCFCCFNLGSMKIHIKLPTTGFVPGQLIQTTINFENTSTVNVTKVCIKLERFLKFHAKRPYPSINTDKEVVKEEQWTSQLSNIVSQLRVPPISPSQLQHCTIINQHYTVCITIHVSGMHWNITKTYPILIGTIPLRSLIPFAPYQQEMPQPSAPVMGYNNDPPPPMPLSLDYAPLNLYHPNLTGLASPDQPGTSTNQNQKWNMPPPSYEECMHRAISIQDQDESDYVHGANKPFAPKYPVYNFSTVSSGTEEQNIIFPA